MLLACLWLIADRYSILRFLGAIFLDSVESRKVNNENLRTNNRDRNTVEYDMLEMIHDLHAPIFQETRRESNDKMEQVECFMK